ncbi:trypsin-like serine protease [Corynebacterium pseudotuberculosis]|uniref:trypsin-like serine protease n=1 Tax=Corynebacterium pseudotuberculosis TaxID=1719 RepID=UPI001313EBEF|nr:trypsin-like serine protease [Corynebacterium pseudotuberculosis]
MKIAKISLISLTCTFTALGLSPAVAENSDNDFASLQASSTVPVNDNRIAALWSAIPSLDDSQETRIRHDCTTSYLGDNFWLTAHHCVSNSPFMDGFLRQSDGEVAGISAIYTKSSADDVALIKVGEGINADTFTLANEPLKIGDEATLTGYGSPHDYASSALTVISEKIDSLNFGNVTYTDLSKEHHQQLHDPAAGIQEHQFTKAKSCMRYTPPADSIQNAVTGKTALCGIPILSQGFPGLKKQSKTIGVSRTKKESKQTLA